jgi:hypothetical protein
VPLAFCYEKHRFEAATKSIETSIDTNRRGFADTESIEPDIDTESRRGEIDTKRIASANRNTMAQPRKSPAPKIWIRQIKAARALLAWSQEDLAFVGEVSLVTIKRLEAKDGLLRGRAATVTELRRTFADAGIEFIPASDSGGPGVRLRIHDIKKAGLI